MKAKFTDPNVFIGLNEMYWLYFKHGMCPPWGANSQTIKGGEMMNFSNLNAKCILRFRYNWLTAAEKIPWKERVVASQPKRG